MAGATPSGGRFSTLLLEGLDHYRKGRMMEAVRAWEEAYLLEPSNLRAREFLRSALERIHAHMGGGATPVDPPPVLPDLAMPVATPPPGVAAPAQQQAAARPARAAPGPHPWLPQTRSDGHTRPPQTASPAQQSRTPSPWDDGPSVALPQEPQEAGDTSGAWGIHEEPLPVPPELGEEKETEIWLRGARELVALNDFSGALELTTKILLASPNDTDAQQMHRTCEENLTQMFESRLGSMTRRPRVVLKPDEVIWLNLDPRAGFVLAQIDGEVSFEDLYAICGLSRLDTARILSQLLEEGVVSADDATPAAARSHSRA